MKNKSIISCSVASVSQFGERAQCILQVVMLALLAYYSGLVTASGACSSTVTVRVINNSTYDTMTLSISDGTTTYVDSETVSPLSHRDFNFSAQGGVDYTISGHPDFYYEIGNDFNKTFAGMKDFVEYTQPGIEADGNLTQSGGWLCPPMITLNSADLSAVQEAVEAAEDGVIIKLPAASVTWNDRLAVSKAISLQGAGIGQTVITAGFTGNENKPAMIFYDPGTDQAPKVFEISAITFDGDHICGSFSAGNPSPTIPTTGLKIHHNRFANCRTSAIRLYGMQFGVFYQNQFEDNYEAIYVGGAQSIGWNYPCSQGGANYPFFEDNTFTQTSPQGGFIVETGKGGRIVFRNNTITGYGGTPTGGSPGEVWDVHGVNFDDPAHPDLSETGTVSVEYYNNNVGLITGLPGTTKVLNHRGGRAIVFNNAITGSAGAFKMTEYQGWSYCTTDGYPKKQQVNGSFYWNNTSGVSGISPSLFCVSGGCSSCGQYDGTYIQLGRDYWFPTAGLDSSKPGSCTTGDYYGATDTGKLYRCNANSWSLQYTPYTYPHPLR